MEPAPSGESKETSLPKVAQSSERNRRLAGRGGGVRAACGSATPTGSSSPALSAGTTSQLDRAITQTMKKEGMPGAIVGVWTRERELRASIWRL